MAANTRQAAGRPSERLVAAGDLKGRLSAGLFANIDLARDMIKLLGEVGVNADFIEKKKVKKTQWLSFGVGELESGDRVIDALKKVDVNVGEIKEFFCKSIASEK